MIHHRLFPYIKHIEKFLKNFVKTSAKFEGLQTFVTNELLRTSSEINALGKLYTNSTCTRKGY